MYAVRSIVGLVMVNCSHDNSTSNFPTMDEAICSGQFYIIRKFDHLFTRCLLMAHPYFNKVYLAYHLVLLSGTLSSNLHNFTVGSLSNQED